MSPLEQRSGFFCATCHRQGFDQPEGANDECHRRRPKAVVQVVTLEPAATHQVFVNGVDGAVDAGITRRKKAQSDELQQRRIQFLSTIVANEAIPLLTPGLGHDFGMDSLCRRVEFLGASRFMTICDPGHAVRGGPAHETREGLRLPFRSVFPDTCIRNARQ